MSRQWTKANRAPPAAARAGGLIALVLFAGLAYAGGDEAPERDPHAPMTPLVEPHRPNIEFRRPLAEPHRPNAEFRRPNIELRKRGIEPSRSETDGDAGERSNRLFSR